MKLRSLLASAALALTLTPSPAAALDAVVTKRTVRLRDLPTDSGQVIPEVTLGVETYGRLDASRRNGVLICHFLAGDSHAAGRYTPRGEPGWWDELIGPGRPIDTDRLFVVSIDLLCNMKAGRDPAVVTTGPASLDPARGEPYGARFPAITVGDQVRAQRAALAALGVQHLRMVTGPSLGGMLAWQLAVDYPDFVDVVVPCSAPLGFSARDRSGFSSAAWAIRSDPFWAFGDYYRTGLEPTWGVAMALHGLSAFSSGEGLLWLWNLPGYLSEAREYEPNHYLWLIDMHTAWDLAAERGSLAAALGRIRAEVVVLGYDDDEFITPETLRDAGDALRAAGVTARVEILPGGHGHLSVLEDLAPLADAFRRALP